MRGADRSKSCAVAAIVAVGVLSACGSDPQGNAPAPNYATVTGAGRHINFPATIERSEYPDACKLLPDDSVQALVGAPVTDGRTTAGCAWTSGNAALPTIALQFVEIGSDAESVYTERRPDGSTARNVADIGSRARTYRVNDNMTTRIDVFEPRVFFRVEVRLATTAPQDLAQADQIGTRVAQLVAAQVS